LILVDTHCHLDDPRFDPDRDEVIRRAWDAGLVGLVIVGADPDRWSVARRIAAAEPRVRLALGLHPHEASSGDSALWRSLEGVGDELAAVGEIGLDYHYDRSPREVQREVFALQLRLARRLGRPVILHEREAAEDVVAALEEVAPVAGVWHCFSGGPDLAARAVGLGLHLGFGGLVTFRRGTEALQAAAATCPLGRLLLETDAPYLAPHPLRGRRNEPAFVAHTARFVAGLRGAEPDSLAAAATANARGLFGL
jgi:TatD DNase family protein